MTNWNDYFGFIEQNESEVIYKKIKTYFNGIVTKYENKFNKRIEDFDYNETKEMLVNGKHPKLGTLIRNRGYVRDYFEWAVNNGVITEEKRDNHWISIEKQSPERSILQEIIEDKSYIENLNNKYFMSSDELVDYLNSVTKHMDSDVAYTYNSICILIWIGIEEENVRTLTLDDFTGDKVCGLKINSVPMKNILNHYVKYVRPEYAVANELVAGLKKPMSKTYIRTVTRAICSAASSDFCATTKYYNVYCSVEKILKSKMFEDIYNIDKKENLSDREVRDLITKMYYKPNITRASERSIFEDYLIYKKIKSSL